MADALSQSCRWLLARGALPALAIAALVGLGYSGVKVDEARRQKQAVAALRELGAWVFYDCRYDSDGTLRSAKPPGPQWLTAIVGVDLAGTVRGVKLTEAEQLDGLATFELLSRPCPAVNDAALVHLEKLEGLQWLALNRAKITDAGLRHLVGLRRLQRLWLDDTHVTDRGLRLLGALTELSTLSLNGTQVTDAGLAHLAPLTRLQRLRLQRTECTLAGILHLLVKLQRRPLAEALQVAGFARRDDHGHVIVLDFSATHVTDADLARLKGFSQLQWLYLNDTGVTDTGLAQVRPLKSLELLHLAGTRITDAGLEHLAGLKRLRTLHLERTQVSDEAVSRLQKALAGPLRVYR